MSIGWMNHKSKGWRLGNIERDHGKFSNQVTFTPMNGDRSSVSCHLASTSDIRPLDDPLPAEEILQAMEGLKHELRMWIRTLDPVV